MQPDRGASETKNRAHNYSLVLLGLLSIFFLRVLAQFLQAVSPVAFLPHFEAWQSGALPYPVLAGFQLALLGYFGQIIYRLRSGSIHPTPESARNYMLVGGVCFLVLLFRLVAGLSFATGHSWFDAPIHTALHLVLAALVFIVGLFHSSSSPKIVAWITYPAVMVLALCGYFLLTKYGTTLAAAALIPVLLSALTITLLERSFPHRKDWRPNRVDVLNDTIYMAVVQNILPRFLGLVVAATVLQSQVFESGLAAAMWPHHWSVSTQMILMLVTAEFLRYWLHRLAHNWKPLWQLHAVHHSSHKLYWVNVGRFHPLEKTLQYLFDALPFILLGVSAEVLALYFVFYAINGFFQHCNIAIRMGPLNFIFSGPELHRWHHSDRVEESNNNYGNNLILWDLVFGTWYLPQQRTVDSLGLVNRNYPVSFLHQLKTPFINGLDKFVRESKS